MKLKKVNVIPINVNHTIQDIEKIQNDIIATKTDDELYLVTHLSVTAKLKTVKNEQILSIVFSDNNQLTEEDVENIFHGISNIHKKYDNLTIKIVDKSNKMDIATFEAIKKSEE